MRPIDESDSSKDVSIVFERKMVSWPSALGAHAPNLWEALLGSDSNRRHTLSRNRLMSFHSSSNVSSADLSQARVAEVDGLAIMDLSTHETCSLRKQLRTLIEDTDSMRNQPASFVARPSRRQERSSRGCPHRDL